MHDIKVGEEVWYDYNVQEQYWMRPHPWKEGGSATILVANMTLTEYKTREAEELEGKIVTTISVASHKTAMKGATMLHLDADLVSQLDQWVDCLRLVAMFLALPWLSLHFTAPLCE